MSNEITPGHTDFKLWERETLEKFAREAADDNRQLREDLQTAISAWRAAVVKSEVATS